MSKVIEASCVGGVVTADSLPVAGTTILSEGVGSSEGLLVLDEDKKTYIAKISPDLKSTLDQLTTALGQLTTALSQAVLALNVLDNKPLGALPPVPAVTANTAAITLAAAQITAAQTALTTLKAALK
jgi:hypothetical protein